MVFFSGTVWRCQWDGKFHPCCFLWSVRWEFWGFFCCFGIADPWMSRCSRCSCLSITQAGFLAAISGIRDLGQWGVARSVFSGTIGGSHRTSSKKHFATYLDYWSISRIWVNAGDYPSKCIVYPTAWRWRRSGGFLWQSATRQAFPPILNDKAISSEPVILIHSI